MELWSTPRPGHGTEERQQEALFCPPLLLGPCLNIRILQARRIPHFPALSPASQHATATTSTRGLSSDGTQLEGARRRAAPAQRRGTAGGGSPSPHAAEETGAGRPCRRARCHLPEANGAARKPAPAGPHTRAGPAACGRCWLCWLLLLGVKWTDGECYRNIALSLIAEGPRAAGWLQGSPPPRLGRVNHFALCLRLQRTRQGLAVSASSSIDQRCCGGQTPGRPSCLLPCSPGAAGTHLLRFRRLILFFFHCSTGRGQAGAQQAGAGGVEAGRMSAARASQERTFARMLAAVDKTGAKRAVETSGGVFRAPGGAQGLGFRASPMLPI